MIGRFGSREICDVTFKALTNHQKVGNKEFEAGQPVFVIDTATASNMEQASNTVYAQGGKGYNRLIAWEGEKTMTFTVTDALMSPLGLAVLTGAGLSNDSATGDAKHIHVTYDVSLEGGKGSITWRQLINELGLPEKIGGEYNSIYVCDDIKVRPYASILDSNGAVVGWGGKVTFTKPVAENNLITLTGSAEEGTKLEFTVADCTDENIKLDFYVRMIEQATEITVGPDDFGGYFYVEADTLYRNQDGKDMAATITFPKVKIQSGFTIAMAANGDPSTFDFVMDAFPAYTYFNSTKKVVCDIVIVSGEAGASGVAHATTHSKNQ